MKQDREERDHMAGLGIVPTASQKLTAYMGNFLNIIDAVAIIPYFLEIILEGFSFSHFPFQEPSKFGDGHIVGG